MCERMAAMSNHNIPLILSIALFAIVTVLDVITTMFALGIGAREINPFMLDIVTSPGMFLAVKLAAIAVLAYLGWHIEKQREGVGVIALTLASAVTILAVHNNFGVIVSLI